MKSLLAALMLLAAPSLVQAEVARPPESVTVTGTRDRQVLDKFVQSFAGETRMLGKIGRWEDGICPLTVGLRPEATKFVTKRVREVAALVGAPVDSRASCKPNLQILFSSHPQILLDNVREKYPQFLGYYAHDTELENIAAVTRPIQAWYMTGTMDLLGRTKIDSRKSSEPDLAANRGGYFPDAAAGTATTGLRIGDGLRATFYRVTVVVDPDRLVEYEIGPLADYITLLSLAQLKSLDSCQQLPSIVNMLAAGCANKANALTDSDLAYLRGLYKMGSGRNLRTEKDEIAYHMEQNLKGQQ